MAEEGLGWAGAGLSPPPLSGDSGKGSSKHPKPLRPGSDLEKWVGTVSARDRTTGPGVPVSLLTSCDGADRLASQHLGLFTCRVGLSAEPRKRWRRQSSKSVCVSSLWLC